MSQGLHVNPDIKAGTASLSGGRSKGQLLGIDKED